MLANLDAPQNGPVLMSVGPKGMFSTGNVWLLVPWDDDSRMPPDEWVREFLQQTRLQPNLILIVTSSSIDEESARQMKRRIGRRLGVCRIDQQKVFNDPQVERKLEHFFDPEYAPKFQAIDVDGGHPRRIRQSATRFFHRVR